MIDSCLLLTLLPTFVCFGLPSELLDLSFFLLLHLFLRISLCLLQLGQSFLLVLSLLLVISLLLLLCFSDFDLFCLLLALFLDEADGETVRFLDLVVVVCQSHLLLLVVLFSVVSDFTKSARSDDFQRASWIGSQIWHFLLLLILC